MVFVLSMLCYRTAALYHCCEQLDGMYKMLLRLDSFQVIKTLFLVSWLWSSTSKGGPDSAVPVSEACFHCLLYFVLSLNGPGRTLLGHADLGRLLLARRELRVSFSTASGYLQRCCQWVPGAGYP